MKSFSSFCIALSAAVLLTGGLPGPAQSQGPEAGWSPTIDGVESQGQLQSLDVPHPLWPRLADGDSWPGDRDGIRNILYRYYDDTPTTFEDPNWTGFSSKPSSPRDLKIIRRMGWSPRDVRSHPSFNDWTGGVIRGTLYISGRGESRKLLLDVAINPKTFDPEPPGALINPLTGEYDKPDKHSGPYIMFPAMEVGLDGSFEGKLEDGRSIAGRIPNFLGNLYNRREMIATYSGLNGLKIYYNKSNNSVESPHNPPLLLPLRLMFFDSQHYSEADYRKNLELAESLVVKRDYGRLKANDNVKREHIERGKSISERDAEDLSVDLRLNADRITNAEERGWTKGSTWRYYYKRWQADLKDRKDRGLPINHDFGPLEERSRNVKNVSCDGLSCTGMLGKRKLKVLSKEKFLPLPQYTTDEEEDVLERVHVVLANQGIYLTLYDGFGAWMDDAGFFVHNKFVDRADILFSASSDSRMVVAIGERTGDPPAADATWRGSMVGTAARGPSRNNFLRGEAELKFDIGDSRLDARFFNIRDYHRFGAKYVSVLGRKPDQIVFPDIPVAADGSYAKKYRKRRGDNHNGKISGAFYGVGHHETAGTFESRGILGAFGAKKVVPEVPAN